LGLPSEIVVAPIQESLLFTQEIEIQYADKLNIEISFNKYNSVEEKIELFMSLFRKRMKNNSTNLREYQLYH
jgi:hypothetical protein